jgi:hypothetical protein
VADSLNETAGPEIRPAGPAPAPAPAQPSRARVLFRGRFAIAYLALALVLGAAAGLLVVFVANDGTETASTGQASRWSEWRPSFSGTLAVREIARQIAPLYRLPNGQQLVGAVAGPMQLRTANGPIPVSVLAIASGQAGVPEQRVEIEFPSAGVFFQLCGAGGGCLIPGDASAERGLLVRREALELSLYTFHYLPEADHVLTFLPPPPGVQPSDPEFRRVVYLNRGHLAPLLRVPLRSALPPGTTTLKPGDLSPEQGRVVDTFTAPQIFQYDFQQLPDQSALVQLSPIEP